MASEEKTITVTIDGNVLTAFRMFCTRTGCQTASEGIRTLIRTIPEFKQISPDDFGNPIKSPAQSQEEKDG